MTSSVFAGVGKCKTDAKEHMTPPQNQHETVVYEGERSSPSSYIEDNVIVKCPHKSN